MGVRTAAEEKRHETQWTNQVQVGGYQPVTPLGDPPHGEPLFAHHGMPNVVSASTSPLFNNPPPGRASGEPAQGEPSMASHGTTKVVERDPHARPDGSCVHAWQSAGFVSNGVVLVLYCTHCATITQRAVPRSAHEAAQFAEQRAAHEATQGR